MRDLRGAAVLETRRLAAGEEAVEVGAGAARPRDLPRAQRRRHDVAPRRAAVARLAAVVPHAEAAMTSLVTSHSVYVQLGQASMNPPDLGLMWGGGQGVREKARVFETLNCFRKGLTQIETDVQLL